MQDRTSAAFGPRDVRLDAMQTTGTIHLVYLARLRERFGTPGETYALSPHVNTVSGLMRELARRGGAWADELAPGRAFRVAVNHTVVDADQALTPGDEVALFPPVTGG